MVRVVHAFPEESEDSQNMHLRYWYGTVRPDDEDEESEAVCWCGGRHTQMGEDVYAIWHVQSWDDRGK